MSFLNEAALFFFSTFKTSFSNFYPNYVKHLRKLKQINLPILPFLSRISTNQFNYLRNNRGIRKTQFPIEKLHNSGFLFDADASEQHVYRLKKLVSEYDADWHWTSGVMHLNAIALEAEEGKETLVVLSRGGRLDTLQDGKRDIWPSASTADRNERGSRSGSEFRSLCSEVGMESWPRKRPRVHPLHQRWCDSWRPDRRRVSWNDDDIKGTGWIFIDRSIFFAQVTFDDSLGLCFCIMHRSV